MSEKNLFQIKRDVGMRPLGVIKEIVATLFVRPFLLETNFFTPFTEKGVKF